MPPVAVLVAGGVSIALLALGLASYLWGPSRRSSRPPFQERRRG